jgi:hypothetical protein
MLARMLEKFSAATFSELIGATFRIRLDDGSALELALASATSAPGGPNERAGSRTPFSLVFRGPLEPVLPQRIYRFDHDGLGEFDLFIVPIGPEHGAMQYEAVFG